jgi:hypothetical protein
VRAPAAFVADWTQRDRVREWGDFLPRIPAEGEGWEREEFDAPATDRVKNVSILFTVPDCNKILVQ